MHRNTAPATILQNERADKKLRSSALIIRPSLRDEEGVGEGGNGKFGTQTAGMTAVSGIGRLVSGQSILGISSENNFVKSRALGPPELDMHVAPSTLEGGI